MSSLVKQFQSVVLGPVRVIGVDSDPLASGAAAADKSYVAPPFHSATYLDWILDICNLERVSLLLSLVPEDLLELESLRPRLSELGVTLVGAPLERIRQTLDKRLLAQIAEGTGLHIPMMWHESEVDEIPASKYPLVIKDAHGRGSRGQYRVTNHSEATAVFSHLRGIEKEKTFILQPQVEGHEFGLDLLNGLDQQPAAVFVRRKLRMRSGETDVAQLVLEPGLDSAGKKLAQNLSHQGIVDCDVMRSDGVDYLLDVNIRFGGGYVFSQAAGANIPAALVAWLLQEEIDPRWLEPRLGQVFARASHLEELPNSV